MFLRRKKLSLYRQTRYMLLRRKGLNRALSYMVWRLKRLPGTPEFIAKGFAIGVAINFWPILYTHLIFGYLFCRLLRGSVLSMFIGTLIGNPLTFALVYPLMYKIGKVMLGLKPSHRGTTIDSVEEVWATIWPIHSWHSLSVAFTQFIWPLMIGGFLLGLPCTIISYYLARNGIRVYQGQRRKHLLKKFEAVEQDIQNMVS